MIISLDFDDTYTRDPRFWDLFAQSAIAQGHTIICVTMRYPEEGQQVRESLGKIIGEDNLYFTGRLAKEKFMLNLGINVSVWVDDRPFWILNSAAP
jgi:hypothetical protein